MLPPGLSKGRAAAAEAPLRALRGELGGCARGSGGLPRQDVAWREKGCDFVGGDVFTQRLLGLSMEDPAPPLDTPLRCLGPGLKTRLFEGPKSIEIWSLWDVATGNPGACGNAKAKG